MKAARKIIPLAFAAAFAFSCQWKTANVSFFKYHGIAPLDCVDFSHRHAFKKEISDSSYLEIAKFADEVIATWKYGGNPPDFCEILLSLFWNAPFISSRASSILLKSIQSERPKWSDALLGVNEPFKNRKARTRAAQIAILSENFLSSRAIFELGNARWRIEGDK